MVTTRSSSATGKPGSGSKSPRNNVPKAPSSRKRVRQENAVGISAPERGDADDATSVRYFETIPVEIFLQICEDLALGDLRNLCLINRRFRHVLTSKTCRRYWQASLTKIEDLPACPPDLNEMQYANLLYGTDCYKCSKAGSKFHFFFRVRYCTACYKKNILTDTAIKALIPDAKRIIHESASPRRLLTRGVSLPWSRHHYPTTETFVKDYLALPQDDDDESAATRDKFWEQYDERRAMLRRTAYDMLNWINHSVNSPWTGAENRRFARIREVRVKLRKLGWSWVDMPSDTALGNLVGDGPPLSTEVWEDLCQKLVPILQQRKVRRLASDEQSDKEYRLAQRKWSLLCFYHDVIRQSVGDVWGLDSYKWLSDGEFFRIPAVAALLAEDVLYSTAEQLAAIRGSVEDAFYERAAECMEQLTSILQPAQEASSESHQESLPTQTTRVRVHAMMKQLSQATSAFWCETCKVVCWFPLVPRFHPPQPKGEHKLRPLHGNRLCPRDQPDLVSRVLESAGLSREFTLAENHNAQLGLFLCSRCDERTARHKTFNDLILHYVKAREWYLDATSAAQTDPKRAYRCLAGDLSELPTIIDHHDWMTSAPLARLDDHKKQQEIAVSQPEFVNGCCTDPEDDPTGRGGEHLSRNYENLALKRTHGKEADLDADTMTNPMRQSHFKRPAIME
ncbi:hypothetical protein FRB99_000088 [Tulasnella sp. 403]|nr:hypothetical protein FRB99_000088 [Tulasnella sp. 403]